MTEKQKECLNEIKELIIKINDTVADYGLQKDFISCLSAGFLDGEVVENGEVFSKMSLMTSFSVDNEEELDDMLSYTVEAYRKEAQDSSSIDYWINLANRDDTIN